MSRRFAIAAVCLSVLFSLLLAEGMARLAGRSPWPSGRNDDRNPRCFAPDPELGWVSRPGVYRFPSSGVPATPFILTTLEDGSRATGKPVHGTDRRARLAMIGCSVVQGWAIGDEETLAWKLQERFPAWAVKNYGTGGYGGYQSLLLLERLLSSGTPPRAVVFGLGDFQEGRNVAESHWLRLLASYEQRGHANVPYVSLDGNGRLVRHPPAPCPRWPLLRTSALMAFLHETWLDRALHDRETRKRETAFEIVSEMARVTKVRGVRFVVLVVWASEEARQAYVGFLERSGIEYVDGTLDLTEPREELLVPVDGHPNGIVQTRWAKRLGDKLEAIGLASPAPE